LSARPKAEELELTRFENVLRRDSRLTFVAVSLSLVMLVAVYAYFEQLTRGLIITGLNRPAYWGMYIVNFVTFTGLSGGGVIVAGIIHAFNFRRFRTVARIAVLMAILCTCSP
jgi:molybdopterin-containing oxidoreductase family membrane subunit